MTTIRSNHRDTIYATLGLALLVLVAVVAEVAVWSFLTTHP